MKLAEKFKGPFQDWDTFMFTPWGRITKLRCGWYSDRYGLLPDYIIEHGDCSNAIKLIVKFQGSHD